MKLRVRAFIVKLDSPVHKYAWFLKDIEVKLPEDIMGYIGNLVYIEIYDIKETDNPELIAEIEQVMTLYKTPARDIIEYLFTLLNIRMEQDGR